MSRSTTRRAAGPDTPSVTPVFPLLLLETMRDMDRPDEVLEGEDLTASMPRRLGLSDVVYLQIHKFREETKKKRPQTPATVADLIRLVIRRPDADEIFEQAGRRVARHAWEQKSATRRRALKLMPSGMRLRSAARGARRLLGELAGNARVEVTKRPFAARLHGSLTAEADPGGPACAFYTGLLSELMTQYTGRPHTARHARCETSGGEFCEWITLVAS
jgi:predicted hydrocarbon binding protein